jgi:membrane-bound lytic murein transglycosylase D
MFNLKSISSRTDIKRIMSPFTRFLLRSFSFLSFLLILGLIIQVFSFFKTETAPSENESSFESSYAIYALDIPEQLEFAGEPVPMEYFDVWEGFDREILVNTYWQSQTLLFIKRAGRYFPVIEPILKEYGIPDDFKYLALAESGLTNAVSPASAVGYWQFLRGTARDYGLEVTEEVDERYHLEKSTVAACRFLLESYNLYGNWTMAAASYNAGRRGINNQISIQKETGYYDLLLNEETQRYIFRILAIKAILEDPHLYGFRIDESDYYRPVEWFELEVNSTIENFADFAIEHNTNYKILKYLNPWLRKPYLTNSHRRTYAIRLPVENGRLRRNHSDPYPAELEHSD